MQAGVTDNVPLHVLGGNIIPVALGQEFMTTTAVRNATLALVVALPKENSTATGEPPAPAVPPLGTPVACSHMQGHCHAPREAPLHVSASALLQAVTSLSEEWLRLGRGQAGAQLVLCCAADRCGGRCGGAPQAGVQNACGHMYLDEGEEMNLERGLNNYITMASQVVAQVRPALPKAPENAEVCIRRCKAVSSALPCTQSATAGDLQAE